MLRPVASLDVAGESFIETKKNQKRLVEAGNGMFLTSERIREGGNEKASGEQSVPEGFFVRLKGLEPPRRETPDPKSGAATNYATAAKQTWLIFFSGAKIRIFSYLANESGRKLRFVH